jgi:hypothetical protein
LNKKERETIYAEWLAGATIYELSKKHHHWQYTIEDVVRGCKINEDKPLLRQQREEADKTVDSLIWGAYRTYSALEYNRSLVAALTDQGDIPEDARDLAIKQMLAWRCDYGDSAQALKNKMKALGCPCKFQFDDYGLIVDVVPM